MVHAAKLGDGRTVILRRRCLEQRLRSGLVLVGALAVQQQHADCVAGHRQLLGAVRAALLRLDPGFLFGVRQGFFEPTRRLGRVAARPGNTLVIGLPEPDGRQGVPGLPSAEQPFPGLDLVVRRAAALLVRER